MPSREDIESFLANIPNMRQYGNDVYGSFDDSYGSMRQYSNHGYGSFDDSY
jgi:hypothetical protein